MTTAEHAQEPRSGLQEPRTPVSGVPGRPDAGEGRTGAFPTEAEREAVAYRLVHHYRVSPPAGDCSCGHVVPLGHSFAAHQADEVLNALSDLVAGRERLAAADAVREVADDLPMEDSEAAQAWHFDLRGRAARIERGEPS